MPPPLFPQDKSHLKALVVCHYVMAGLSCLGMLFLIGHFAIMHWVLVVAKKSEKQGDPDMEMFLPLMGIFYLMMGLLALAFIIMNFLSARYLTARKKWMFSMVTAGVNCLGGIPGIALGVCTFIVLLRESVKTAYKREH